MLILEGLQTAGGEQAPTAGRARGWCGVAYTSTSASDGVICPVPAEQDWGLDEMHPPPKPAHMLKSSKKGHEGTGFPSPTGVYPSAEASEAGGGSCIFFFAFVLGERMICLRLSHPRDSLIRLHTAPHEFIGLSPGLQKIIQDYSEWRSGEGGHVLCL